MAEIVNLNQSRKRAARLADAAEARENRARFGRTAAQRQNDQRAAQRRAALLDGARREDAPASRAERDQPSTNTDAG